MNKVNKKTIILGILALGVTVIPITGLELYKNKFKDNLQTEYLEKYIKEETEEIVINKEIKEIIDEK